MRVFKLGTWSALALVACGGGSSEDSSGQAPAAVIAAPAQSAAPAPVTAPVIVPVAAPPAPTTTTPPTTGAPTCGPSNLCLDVSSLRTGMTPHAGRLVLVWLPLAGGQKEIAYDVPFLGTETSITIPLANVTAPSDANAFCDKRDGGDPASSKCTGTLKMSYGMIAIAEDQNANGKTELGENVLGLSDVNVLYSLGALKPPPKDFIWNGQPMTQAFPSGVEMGANAYVAASSGSTSLVAAAAGQKFKLQVCDTTNQQECSIKAPF